MPDLKTRDKVTVEDHRTDNSRKGADRRLPPTYDGYLTPMVRPADTDPNSKRRPVTSDEHRAVLWTMSMHDKAESTAQQAFMRYLDAGADPGSAAKQLSMDLQQERRDALRFGDPQERAFWDYMVGSWPDLADAVARGEEPSKAFDDYRMAAQKHVATRAMQRQANDRQVADRMTK